MELNRYYSDEATVFRANITESNWDPAELAAGIASLSVVRAEKMGFWIKLEKYRGVRKIVVLVAFKEAPDILTMDIPIRRLHSGYAISSITVGPISHCLY